MRLNEKQKQAVEYLEGPLLVLAGPGTGKTQLLSEKVAYILKNTDTNPENILCMTFTESGVFNMRERLQLIVGKDGAKVNIHTYHAFGSDILANYRNYSDEYDRKLDSAIDEVTQFRIVKQIQDNLNSFLANRANTKPRIIPPTIPMILVLPKIFVNILNPAYTPKTLIVIFSNVYPKKAPIKPIKIFIINSTL